ncbi:thioredoxin domain-containing protein [Tunturiibacter empetritectus]|uniref:Protein-disulfide isomerase n=2 Tax=Tunturiibacter TaxID=3154218 RepID=A0A852VF10_9BACT|nr:thioredoxin domain-containing protein [Edaphobacter lichenicola]NYF90167.1 protein-disulfide isomerase [Edaphobacter lichenicola]
MSISFAVFRCTLFLCLTLGSANISQAGEITGPPNQPLSPELKWRIEVIFRSHAELPPESTVEVGPRVASLVPGYDQVEVSYIANGIHSKPVDLLLSKDGTKMAQFRELEVPSTALTSLADETRPRRGGPSTAPVRIVIFDDLECPFCARLNQTLFPALLDRYGEQVHVVYRDMPSEGHPWAVRAAVDTNCLAKYNSTAYWEAVDQIHKVSSELGGQERTLAKANEGIDAIVLRIAERSHLDVTAVNACVSKQDAGSIKQSQLEAEDLGVIRTPTLFINGAKIEGAVPVTFLFQIIDDALRSQGIRPPVVAIKK